MTDLPVMTYRAALDELIGKAKAQELTEEVVRALARLFDHPEKLFCWKPDDGLTAQVGAANLSEGLQASDLLVKLVLAVRALDWEVVIVASEQHGHQLQKV